MPAKQRSTSKHPQNVNYKSQNRRLRNKVIKLKRHVARFPDDKQANDSLVLVSSNQPGVKGKRTWVRKYKTDERFRTKGVVNNRTFMYRERVG